MHHKHGKFDCGESAPVHQVNIDLHRESYQFRTHVAARLVKEGA